MCIFAKNNGRTVVPPALKGETPFVKHHSIVRTIWKDSNAILLIFAAAAGEFAYNRSADWLFFTGKLPNDPIGRLFSTIAYAQSIVFATQEQAITSIHKINSIHKAVEDARGTAIPQWAYRSVLFMLIDYTIKAGHLLGKQLTQDEQEEIHRVFIKMGVHMGISNLPATLSAWRTQRTQHLMAYTTATHHSIALYRSYKQHLGVLRYYMLRHIQAVMCPQPVLVKGSLSKSIPAAVLLAAYLHIRHTRIGRVAIHWLMPPLHRAGFAALNK
jgi:hypothetical protein